MHEFQKEEPSMSFSENMSRLEDVVTQLENESLSLDDAVCLFEKGVGLVDECERNLDTARQKISLLTPEGKRVPFVSGARETGETL